MGSTATATSTETADANVRLLDDSKNYVPGGLHSNIRLIDPPLCVRRSQGAYLWDENNRRYIDYHAAFATIILGHCYGPVVDRVSSEIRHLDLFGATTTYLELELAKKIVKHVPSAEQVLQLGLPARAAMRRSSACTTSMTFTFASPWTR